MVSESHFANASSSSHSPLRSQKQGRCAACRRAPTRLFHLENMRDVTDSFTRLSTSVFARDSAVSLPFSFARYAVSARLHARLIGCPYDDDVVNVSRGAGVRTAPSVPIGCWIIDDSRSFPHHVSQITQPALERNLNHDFVATRLRHERTTKAEITLSREEMTKSAAPASPCQVPFTLTLRRRRCVVCPLIPEPPAKRG